MYYGGNSYIKGNITLTGNSQNKKNVQKGFGLQQTSNVCTTNDNVSDSSLLILLSDWRPVSYNITVVQLGHFLLTHRWKYMESIGLVWVEWCFICHKSLLLAHQVCGITDQSFPKGKFFLTWPHATPWWGCSDSHLWNGHSWHATTIHGPNHTWWQSVSFKSWSC